MKEAGKESQGAIPLNQGMPQSPPLYYQMPPPEDEIDLFELFLSLISQWKLIISITVIGALISIAVVLTKPKAYESKVSIRIPTASQIAPINTHGYTQFKSRQLFKRYYDKVKSEENLKNYLIKTNPFPKMTPDFDEKNLDKRAAKFAQKLSVNILEPKIANPKKEIVKIPELFGLSLSSTTEEETAAVLNGYIQYSEDMLKDEIRDDGLMDISLQIYSMNRDIQLLRSNAKRSRELLIDKLTVENRQKINAVQQNIALLRTKAKENRLRLIEKMKEGNATKIDTLQQQIDLLKEKKTKEIANQIIHLQEAYQLAESAGIKKPTTLDMLAATNSSKDSAPKTQINVSTKSNSMQFLLGTEYLLSKIDILKNRTNVAQFIPKILNLKSQIESIRNDTKIKEIENRSSDDPYIGGLQDLMNKITALENDNRILALKSRETDDPFIKLLPEKLNKLNRLKQISFEFGDASLYRLDQAATVAKKRNRKLIVLIGTLLSGMVALFIALIVIAAQKRALRSNKEIST